MKEKNILVFIPNTLLHHQQIGYLKGSSRFLEYCDVYYITSDTPTKNNDKSIGYIGENFEYDYITLTKEIPLFISNVNGHIKIANLRTDIPVTQIIYDYVKFKNSDVVCHKPEKFGEHFHYLSKELRKFSHNNPANGKSNIIECVLRVIISFLDFLLTILSKPKKKFQWFSTFMHFEKTVRSLRWFFFSILDHKHFSPKIGNFITAKIVDLCLGIILTSYILDFEVPIFKFINFMIQSIIAHLKGLLLYLMDQPIGLKLNFGYNNFLGKFFLYHISLWRIFLNELYPLLAKHFKFIVLPGVFGFSYQIAMVSDIVSVATFHSYCIYIYAARLFNLQLKCLKSLWRVLIGRKFNPLRNRVDSCQYSQNQLFIGTLSFTILLFLLPTTTMYYIVFTVFRLITLSLCGFLQLLRNIMYTIPIYSTFLWIINSSLVAGNINIAWKSLDNIGNITIEVKLDKAPLIKTIRNFSPDYESTLNNEKSFGEIFHSTLSGTIL